ncbi:penicillin acylase family protein [Bacillus wiedmannii]|nr:penicillin acylase family protein [Bacillus wiedmannii]PHA58031.1 penicillin acylase family protein [Bacillus wiedmannii]
MLYIQYNAQKNNKTKTSRVYKPFPNIKKAMNLGRVIFYGSIRAFNQNAYRRLREHFISLEKEYVISGLSEEVIIYKDNRGIPHIEASNLNDVYKAQGFITTKDRLWQMDMSRRLVNGRLSEILGPDLINNDKLFRSFSLFRSAQKSICLYSEETLEWMQSYCDGVNTYIEHAKKLNRLPVEFTILDYEPEPWSILDMLSIGRLLSYSLSHNFTNEIFRFELQKKIDDELFEEIKPNYPSDGPITIPDYMMGENVKIQQQTSEKTINNLDFFSDHLAELLNLSSEVTKGSNGWVISGKHTKSGKPILANDPHIEMQAPSTWYQTHLKVNNETENMNVIGVTLPGVCGIILGHNDKIAWGVTNNRADVQDLFIEKRNPSNPNQFQYKGKWEEAEVIEEVIKVKGQADVAFPVVVTRHGPIISDVIGNNQQIKLKENLALQWNANYPTCDLEALLDINRSKNWEEFRNSLRKYSTPVLNFLFASEDGTIAYRVGGKIPIRNKGNGLLPVPGCDDEFEWKGFIPFEELPEVVNPKQGFIVSANNKVIGDHYPYMIASSWDAPYRAKRINQMLRKSIAENTPLVIEDVKIMQDDTLNLQAVQLLNILLPVLYPVKHNKLETECIRILQKWDCKDTSYNAAPLIYHFWWWEICCTLFKEKMGTFLFEKMVDRMNITDELIRKAAQGNDSTWFNNAGGFEKVIIESFKKSIITIIDLQGNNPYEWKWGEFHHFITKHPFGKKNKFIGNLINPQGKIPIGGSYVTVALASYDRKTGHILDGAPWRMVVDLKDCLGMDINAPGQSGNFLSHWYDDQSLLYVNQQLETQKFKPEQYRNSKMKVKLKPSKSM